MNGPTSSLRHPSARLALWICVSLLLVAPGAALASDVLEPRRLSDESFSESYTFIADLDDGVYVQLQLGVSNIGFGSGRGACSMLMVEPDRAPETRSSRVKRDEWRYQPGPPSRLEVGRCSITRGEETSFRAVFDDVELELTLAAPIEPLRPPFGRIDLDSGFYESDLLIRWASATLRVVENGSVTRSLAGNGYADHSRSTLLPANLASRWVRFRGFGDGDSSLVLVRLPADDGPAVGWLWREGSDAPVRLRRFAFEARPGQEKQFDVDLTFEGGHALTLNMEQVLYRNAPIEDAGIIGRMLKRIVGNPVTYTYRAKLVSPRGEGDGIVTAGLSGIGEVTFID